MVDWCQKTLALIAIIIVLFPIPSTANGGYADSYVPKPPEGFAMQWQPNFDVYYSAGSQARIGEVAADATEAYSTVTAFFHGYQYRTKIIIASSQEEYESIMGLGKLPEYSMGTGWADGEKGTIVIKSPVLVPNFNTVLTHELAHIETRSYIQGYKYALPDWFSEGLAVYVSGDLPQDKRRTIDDRCREGRLMSIAQLEETHHTSTDEGADINEVGAAYTQSGLILEYIGQKYDNAAILKILDAFGPSGDINSAFMTVIGKSPDQINNEWRSERKGELDRVDGKILEQTVSGYVVDQHGMPMPNETVSFTALRNDSIVQGTLYRAMSNDSGFYELNVTYGPLLVVADKLEYEGYKETINLARKESKYLNVTLNGTALELRLAAEAKADADRRNTIYMMLVAFNAIAITAGAAIVMKFRK